MKKEEIERQKTIKLLKRQLRQAYRAIDDNPFITHKVSWVAKLCGVKYSQADLYKQRIKAMTQKHIDLINAL